jgi:hypothetical protein
VRAATVLDMVKLFAATPRGRSGFVSGQTETPIPDSVGGTESGPCLPVGGQALKRILTLFEGENIVSPPQNRRVCDGLVTALFLHPIDLAQSCGGAGTTIRPFSGSQAGPRRTICRLGSRWRHPAAAALRQYSFLKTLFADPAIRAAIPTDACRYPVRHPGASLQRVSRGPVMSRLQSALSFFVFAPIGPRSTFRID